MNALVKKFIVGTAGLVLAAAPLAASAQTWHDNGNDRGGYRSNADRGYDNRGYDNRSYDNRRREDRDRDRDRDDRQRFEHRRYPNGYYGRAPGGFMGYYRNGHWYQHRRPGNGGIWIYF
jgi:hypothetical protein